MVESAEDHSEEPNISNIPNQPPSEDDEFFALMHTIRRISYEYLNQGTPLKFARFSKFFLSLAKIFEKAKEVHILSEPQEDIICEIQSQEIILENQPRQSPLNSLVDHQTPRSVTQSENISVSQTTNSQNHQTSKEPIIQRTAPNPPEFLSHITPKPIFSKLPGATGVLFSELVSPTKNQSIVLVFVLDNISLHLFGACRSCHNVGDNCKECMNKKSAKRGIRLQLSGYTLAEKLVECTAWSNHIPPLTGLNLSQLTDAITNHPEHIYKAFLQLYRGKLFYITGFYNEYKSTRKISVKTLQCIRMDEIPPLLLTEEKKNTSL